MQVLREGDAVYVGHYGITGMGTTILDASDPTDLRLIDQWPAPPGTHTHKVQVGDGLLLVNEEIFRGGEVFEAGMPVYDISDPMAPRRVGRYESGGMGVHRIVWTGGRYAHVSATPTGAADRIWVVIDLSDPEHPVEAGRYVLDEPQPEGTRYAAHHALIEGDTAYLSYTSAGLVVLDVSDMTAPRKLSRLMWEPGDRTHTCMPLPGRDIVVVTDEATHDGPGTPSPPGPARFQHRAHSGPAERRFVRAIDVSDRAAPRVVSVFPEPEGDFAEQPLRFGPHNLHENRPGSYRSSRLVFVTYFNAGLRVYDVADPASPVEVAHWLPEAPDGQPSPQSNDLFVESGGRVWVTDRLAGGLYLLEPDARLRALMDACALPD